VTPRTEACNKIAHTPAMSTKAEILNELHSLINDQMEALRENLGPDEIQEYAERKKRIDALLEQLGKNGAAKEFHLV
jgi:DNA-binding protein H-NS